MNRMVIVFVLCISAALAFGAVLLAQQTRTVVTKATTPYDDSKPNSPDVPEAYALSGQFERVLVMRFKYDTDLLAGIESLVAKHHVKNAVILSAIGSVRGYHLHVVSNRTFPSKNIFLRDPIAPADLIGMNGYVIDGRVHAHLTLATADKAFGGHLEPDTKVFTFVVVTLGVLGDDVDLRRVDDKTYR
jgi:predicted DNA-binding protein with PD1-like motif